MSDDIDNQDVSLGKTPAELVELFTSKNKPVKVVLLEFYNQPAIVVKIRLKYWHRLKAVMNSDYRDKIQMQYQQEAEKFMPSEIAINVVLVI